MRIIVTVLWAQRINVYGRVDISLLQPAKKQSNAAGAEHHIAHEHVVISDCVKWMWLILSLQWQMKVGMGNVVGKPGLQLVELGRQRREMICVEIFFFFWPSNEEKF